MAARTDLEQLVYQMSADITQLTKQSQKAIEVADKSAGRIQERYDKLGASMYRGFGKPPNFGKALDKIFDRSSLGLIEEGTTRLRVFGSAIEPLGGLGIAAAAGVAVMAAAFEEASKAAEFAELLDKTAKKLGITTDALQELDFVALKTGVSQEALREGIQKVSQAIGAYTSNVKDTRVKSVFEALGISKDDARAFDGPVDGLEKIADAISKIQNRSQQLALLKSLRVPDDMVPVLLQGGDAIKQMAAEAHNLGLVMDHGMVERGAEFAEQLKVTKDIVSHDLMRAFIDLAPVIQGILKLVAKLAEYAADTAENLGAVHFDKKTGTLSDEPDSSKESTGKIQRDVAGAKQVLSAPLVDWRTGALNPGDKKAAQAVYAAGSAELARRAKEQAAEDRKTNGGGAKALVDEKLPKAKKGPADQTASKTGEVDTAADESAKALDTARAALITNVEDHAAAEKKATADELDKQIDSLEAKEAEIAASKGLTAATKKALIGRLDEAEQNRLLAASAKDMATDAKAAQETSAKLLSEQELIDRFYDEIGQIAISMAKTAGERRSLELKALAERKREEDRARAAAEKQELADNTVNVAAGGQDHSREIKGRYAQESAAAGDLNNAQQAQTLRNTDTPWEKWLQEGRDAATGVGDALQSAAVKGIDDFNAGVADAIVNGKSLGATMKAVLADMEGNLIKYLLKQAEVGLFSGVQNAGQAAGAGGFFSTIGSLAKFLPAHAGGTNSAPGGPSLVGEKGPEIVNLAKGSTVTPNDMLRGLSGAPRAVSLTQNATMNHHVTIDLTGANGDDTIRQIAGQAAAESYRQSVATSGAQMQAAMRQVAFDQSVNG